MTYAEKRDREILSEPGTAIVPPGPGGVAFFISFLLTVVVTGLFFWMASNQGEVPLPGDLGSTGNAGRGPGKYRVNMLIRSRVEHGPAEGAGSTENLLRWLPHMTDGDIEPLWPWVMAGQVDPEHQEAGLNPEKDAALVRNVRTVEIWMGAGFLLLCGLMAARSIHPGAVLPAILPGALLALLAYGTDFSPAGMNYILVFLCWVCALGLLRNNNVWLHGVFGILTGLAWLTDATSIFIVAAWLGSATLRWLWTSLRRGEQAMDETWIARNHFIGLVAVVLGWVSVCGARCGAAMDHWGRPLFSWHQHWMWMDSETEALALADRYEETRALENGRRINLPGVMDYVRRHNRTQAIARLEDGVKAAGMHLTGLSQQESSGMSVPARRFYSRQTFWLAGAAVIFAAGWVMAVMRPRLPDRNGVKTARLCMAPALFTVFAAGAYLIWYGWYTPVRSGPEYIMVLYAPLLWTLITEGERLVMVARARGAPSRVWLVWRAGLAVWSVIMAADVALLLSGTDAAHWL